MRGLMHLFGKDSPLTQACKDIIDVFNQINNDSFRAELRMKSKLGDNEAYGLTNEYEMLAEMSNPVFRAALKAKKLWRQLINGIRRILQFDVIGDDEGAVDAYTVLNNALSTIMDNFDARSYSRYVAFPMLKEFSKEVEDENGAKFRDGDVREMFELSSIKGVKNDDTEDGIHYRSVEAESDERMAARAQEVADKLNTPVRIVQSEEEVAQLPTRRKRRAKGWYDTATGEVVIVVPNHENMADVENTVAHEIVAHKGLRKLIGEERFNSFLDDVYNNLGGKIKAVIE